MQYRHTLTVISPDIDTTISQQTLKVYQLQQLLDNVSFTIELNADEQEMLQTNKRLVRNIIGELEKKGAILDKEDLAELNIMWGGYKRMFDQYSSKS